MADRLGDQRGRADRAGAMTEDTAWYEMSRNNRLSSAHRPEAECPICPEVRHAYLFVVQGLPVVRCPGCGLISLNPQPSVVDFAPYYGNPNGGQVQGCLDQW